jgi:hypothetical protein
MHIVSPPVGNPAVAKDIAPSGDRHELKGGKALAPTPVDA